MRHTIIDNRKEGQERIIDKFLLFPKRIGNEIRWFERAKIKQSLHRVFDIWWEWRDIQWVN